MKTLPIAAQVYSVRQDAEADFAGTMARLKEMGYDGVELAGLYGKTPQEIKTCLDSLSLKAISAHVPYEELQTNPEATIQAYREIGCDFLAIPWLGESHRYGGDKYEEMLASLPAISEACRKQGITLLYHNHAFEFEKTENGKWHLDLLYSAAAPEVLGVELDTCWAKVGGADPSAYLLEYSGRCPLVHVKDFRRKDESVELVALGEGEQNVTDIVNSACECGSIWLIVEQDDHPYGTPMENMKKSIDCLKKIMA